MNKLIISFAFLGMIFTSCDKDDDPVPNPDGSFPESTELSGTQSTGLILTNHVVDPNIPDYCVSGNYFIQADVVVEPGVTILMKNGAKVHVRNNGSFKSVGTESEKIRIFGEETFTAGQWANIHFSTTNSNNQLIHTNITGGGNATTYQAMVYIGHQGSALIDNCVMSYSSTNGIMAENHNATVTGISDCYVGLCGLYPIKINSRHLGSLSSSITGGGNTHNLIEVVSSQLQTPFTWRKTDFPYHINGNLGIITDVEVEAGTAFFFASGTRIQISGGGSLHCIGTATRKIRFRADSNSQGPGAWETIAIIQSMNPLNRFEHCSFDNGGGDSNYQGMITLWLNAYARVGNSSITNSAGYGVMNNGGNSQFVDDGNNTWSGNALGNIGT